MKRHLIHIGLGVLFIVFFAVALSAAGEPTDPEMMYWESIRDYNDPKLFKSYLEKYPDGHFAPIAKIMIENSSKLKRKAFPPPGIRQNNPMAIPKPSVQLRSQPAKILEPDLNAAIKRYNFCIQERNQGGDFKNNLIDNLDGTVTDATTGLIWQQNSSRTKLNRYRADRYILKLNWEKYGGHTNWRLPTIEELASLMEREPQKPLWLYLDAIFNDPDGIVPHEVWSADDNQPGYGCLSGGWMANFWRGTIMDASWEVDPEAQANTAVIHDRSFVKAVCSPE